MLRFLVLFVAFVYCDAGVASGLHSSGPLLAGGLGNGAVLGAGSAYALGNGNLGLGYGGLGLGNGLGLGYGSLGYGSGSLGLAGPGLTSLGSISGGLGLAPGSLGLGNYGLAGGLPVGPVHAAIQSQRTYEVRPLALPQDPAVPQVIEVDADTTPVQVIFRSLSSPVLVQQIHTPGAPGQVEATQSEDEPHRVTHEVLRPVIQEIREVIQPYRRVTQEVRPVLEEVHTVVAKGEGRIRGAVAPVVGDGGGLLSYGGRALGGGPYGSGLVLAGGLDVPYSKYLSKKAAKGAKAAKAAARAA